MAEEVEEVIPVKIEEDQVKAKLWGVSPDLHVFDFCVWSASCYSIEFVTELTLVNIPLYANSLGNFADLGLVSVEHYIFYLWSVVLL